MDQRHISRDSLFLSASLRVAGKPSEYRVRVRNLSPGGMMGEGSVRLVVGARVEVEVRNLGWVAGSVAWVQDNRCGIAFDDEIDAKSIRAASTPSDDNIHFRFRKPLAEVAHTMRRSGLRKI